MPALQLDSLDKSTWQTFRFEQIARSIGERVEPSETDLETYVGLEHIDPESIHIKRFGSRDDVSGTKLRCYPGDVIFGRRRAYQRKAAICEFDGFCSAHSLVLRANPKVIDPKLFPFFLHSDTFMHRAVDISVGSLSPTINWKTLKIQQFLLPPKDQQAKLAELLWAADGDAESLTEAAHKLNTYRDSLRDHLVFEGIDDPVEYSPVHKRNISKRFVATTIGKLLEEGTLEEIQDGNHGNLHPKSSQYVPEGIPFIMANTLINGQVDLANAKRLPQKVTDRLRIGFAKPRDVLLSHKGTIGETAIVPANLEFPYLMLTPQVTYYRCAESALLPEFLFQAFNSAFFQEQLRVLSSQSTRSYIGITSQRKLKIAIPKDIEFQRLIISAIHKSESAVSSMRGKIACSSDLLKSLINQIF
jgi:type I restriction enzyme S subunit